MVPRDKTVAESKVEVYHLIRPGDLNSVGRLYGGTLVAWIDEVAATVAKRHAQMGVTTGSIDNLRFLQGVFLTDTLVISGKVTYVGNCSMEVKVVSYVEHIDGKRELINKAFLTLIGLDDNGKPTRLPRLILETEEDKKEWEEADTRREMRKLVNRDGYYFYGKD